MTIKIYETDESIRAAEIARGLGRPVVMRMMGNLYAVDGSGAVRHLVGHRRDETERAISEGRTEIVKL